MTAACAFPDCDQTDGNAFEPARAALARGDFHTAADLALAALTRNGADPEGWRLLGDAARRIDQPDSAREAYTRALELRPHDADCWYVLGTLLVEQHQLDDAITAFDAARKRDAARIDSHTNLALLHYVQGAYDLALAVLTEALSRDPDNLRALLLAARVQHRRGRLAEAEALCQLVLSHDASWTVALQVLGRVLLDAGHPFQAEVVLRDLLRIEPGNAEARHELGVVLKVLGRLEEARAQFETALHIDPHQHATYGPLADLVDFSSDPVWTERFVVETQALAADPRRLQGRNDPLIAMHYATAKALDASDDPAAAIAHYRAGAGLQRAQLAYDEAQQAALHDAIRATFTPALMRDHGLVGNPSQVPVFIVGMARSGSTLVEQVLASHPAVFGGDEARHLPQAIDACTMACPPLPAYPALAGVLTQDQADAIATGWLSAATAEAGSALRVTDKLLTNYAYLGLIAMLFPNAKIIHTLRDPVDTCLSAYGTLFADTMAHTYDFGELARHYDRYLDLMAHWRAVLPAGMMTTVRYEDIVHDLEGEARRLVDFIGLDWDARCLAFHASRRAVKTASVVQVRRPIHTRSVARWRRYGPALDPLITALEPTRGKPGGLEIVAEMALQVR